MTNIIDEKAFNRIEEAKAKARKIVARAAGCKPDQISIEVDRWNLGDLDEQPEKRA